MTLSPPCLAVSHHFSIHLFILLHCLQPALLCLTISDTVTHNLKKTRHCHTHNLKKTRHCHTQTAENKTLSNTKLQIRHCHIQLEENKTLSNTQTAEYKTLSHTNCRQQDTVTHNLKKTRYCHTQLEKTRHCHT